MRQPPSLDERNEEEEVSVSLLSCSISDLQNTSRTTNPSISVRVTDIET